MIVLSLVNHDLKLQKIYLSLVESSTFHDSSSREHFIQYLNQYYIEGGNFKDLIKTMTMLKVVSSYSLPKYGVKSIPMDEGRAISGIRRNLNVETLESSYNIKNYDITDKTQIIKLALESGMNKNLALAFIKHNSGAYYKPTFSVFITAFINFN